MNISKRMVLLSTLISLFTMNSFAADMPAAKTEKLTPAEIGTLATVATIDKGEILVSSVALNKNPSSGVEEFANMMVKMHSANLTQILEMATAMHGFPLKGAIAEKMHAQNTKALETLGGLQGDQFDKAYVDAMVQGHQGALNLIDTQLMKTAKSDEMKKFMTDTRAVVMQHLDAAKKLQDNMKS